MFKRLTGRSYPLPDSPVSSKSGIKSKSQPLIICSAAWPNLAAAKPAPEPCSTQGDLLPPEILISILNGFATSLLVDKDRFELLKSKCLEGAKLGHNDESSVAPTGSILKSSHTVLTYLSWGIRHLEKASASLQHGEKESKAEHLTNAEQMLKSLIDSMQLELNDHPTAILSSARVPNACFILALAHVFLALVCKLRKNTSNLVASHLLEAFIVSPNITRQSFIPELWNQLFRPHLSAVEVWHRKEHLRIVSSFSSTLEHSKPCSPKAGENLVSPIPTNSVFPRANSLMDLVSGMRLSRRGTSSPSHKSEIKQHENEKTRLLEKMSMQVKLLSNLYEKSLDEGTIQYARHYKDLVVSYSERFSLVQYSSTQTALQNNLNDYQPQLKMVNDQVNMQEVTTTAGEAAPPNACSQVNDEAVDGKHTPGGWIGANALHLRRSLFDAIFGTVPMPRTSKKDIHYSSSPSSQISSLLHFCNKDLPEIIDPLKPKVETNPAATSEPSARSLCAAGKPTTIRDVVNAAFLTEPDTTNSSDTGKVAVRGHSLSAKTFFEDNLGTPDRNSGNLMIDGVSDEQEERKTELPLVFSQNNHPRIAIKRDIAVTTGNPSKRLIDFIKDRDQQSHSKSSSTPSHKAHETVNRLSSSYQTKMSTTAASMDSTTVEEQRTMKRSNSESSKKNYTSGGKALKDEGPKTKNTSKLQSSRSGNCTSETALVKFDASKTNRVHNQKREEVQVKYCTSVHVQQTRSLSTTDFESQFIECANIEDASYTTSSSEPDVKKGESETARKSTRTQLEELAKELRVVVQATQSNNNAPEGVGRCEEVLLKLSQAWLECKSATLLQEKGASNEEANSVSGKGGILDILDDLTHELLFILANSELQEAQRLALCLLSACIGTTKTHSNEPTLLSQYDYNAQTRGECNKSNTKQLPSDPNVLHALSHLLRQQGRLPEAALLLHLLHPAQYSASCHHFLPHLLPLLLDLAQRNTMPTTQNTFDHLANSYGNPFNGRLHLIGESLKPRALALMMMSRLLAAADKATRLQACKHVLFPNVNAVPCLLHSLDCAPTVDERIAAAFILTTFMQADESCRHHIVNHVKLPFVVALLQQSAANSSVFQTAVNFVSELLRARKANIAELLSSIRQDGVLNCMHALMAYLQTASLENQPPAAGLLLQLDLLLGDEYRYSVFREEALEALLSPLLKGSNREATFNAVHVLSTIGRNHSQQELEAWLLKKAGLGATFQEGKFNTSSTANRTEPVSREPEHEEEEESTMVAEWDEKVACALIEQGGGGLVSNALAKGLQSSMAEVRKACLLVAAWLTSHMRPFHQNHSAQLKQWRLRRDQNKASAKELMREALQAQLQDIAAVGSGCAIVERVFAALALQNLAK